MSSLNLFVILRLVNEFIVFHPFFITFTFSLYNNCVMDVLRCIYCRVSARYLNDDAIVTSYDHSMIAKMPSEHNSQFFSCFFYIFLISSVIFSFSQAYSFYFILNHRTLQFIFSTCNDYFIISFLHAILLICLIPTGFIFSFSFVFDWFYFLFNRGITAY